MLATTHFRSSKQLCQLLTVATSDERLAITRIVNPKAAIPLEATPLGEAICSAGGHSFGNWSRGMGIGYLELVSDTAEDLKVTPLPMYEEKVRWDAPRFAGTAPADADVRVKKWVEDLEQKVLIKALQVSYEGMNPQQRAAFDAHLNSVAQRFGGKWNGRLAGTAGIMAVGSMGGFATYTLLTTAMHAVTFGALSFGAYTAAASLLHLVLGPVGWTALGGLAILKLGAPKTAELVPIVCNVAIVRQRLQYENAGRGRR